VLPGSAPHPRHRRDAPSPMAPMLPDGDPTGQAGPLRSRREAADPRSPAMWAGTRDGSNTTVTCATNGAADEDHCIQDVHICPDPSAGSQFGLLAQSPCARSSGGKSLVSNAAQVSWSPTAAGAHADEGRAAPHNCALGWAINSALAADSAAMPSRDLARCASGRAASGSACRRRAGDGPRRRVRPYIFCTGAACGYCNAHDMVRPFDSRGPGPSESDRRLCGCSIR